MSAAIMAAPVLVRQAIRKHQAGQLDSACELYERALEIDPVDPDALNLLGALHLQRGDLASAVPYSARAVLSDPRAASAYNNLGLIMKQADQVAGAARCYHQATLVNTMFAEAHCNLGVVLKAENQTVLAIQHYRRATEIDPTLGEAFNNLANALQELGELEDAVENYLTAARYMKASDTVHYNVGLLLDRLGRKEEALVHLHEALKVNLAGMSADVTKVVFPVSIYDAENRGQSFGQVTNAFIRVVNQADGREIARFDLSEDASTETAMVFGELYRHGGEWKFRAVGQGYASGLHGIAKDYGVGV